MQLLGTYWSCHSTLIINPAVNVYVALVQQFPPTVFSDTNWHRQRWKAQDEL